MAVERIQAQLENEKFAFAYSGETLARLAQQLQSHLNVPVLIDTVALEEYGIGIDTPITFNVEGISTRSALRLCLNQFDLTYSLLNEVILITTVEEDETMLDARVYDVSRTRIPCDKLIDLITETVLEESWDTVGGPGKIAEATPTTLVIAQTERCHERIADLLQQLTRAASPK